MLAKTSCSLFNPFSNSLQNSSLTMIGIVDSSEKQISDLSCAITLHSNTQDDLKYKKKFLHIF